MERCFFCVYNVLVFGVYGNSDVFKLFFLKVLWRPYPRSRPWRAQSHTGSIKLLVSL